METGTVHKLDLERGFGFIRRRGGASVFFHFSQLLDLRFDAQLLERHVRFDIAKQRDGRDNAVNITAEDS